MSERLPAPPATTPRRELSTGQPAVYLVGAGPGDPDLLTLKARRLLDASDAVLHDSLAGDEIVGSLPDDTEVVDVGKSAGAPTSQGEINHQMVSRYRRGETVVRLKGGDPYVFGRGGEEVEHLETEDVDYEVVPGVSSVSAAPAAAGVPLTHREHASSFTVVTGHEDPSKESSALDWSALARTLSVGGTLVVLMGVGRLPEYVEELRRHGVSGETPVALVESATLDGETYVSGSLDDIVERTRGARVEPPAVTVVGDVVSLAR